MITMERDPGLDALLDLNGQVIVLNSEGYRIQFRVTAVPASLEKPHGLDYSLTLHSPSGERLVGFDNGHAVGSGRQCPGSPAPGADGLPLRLLRCRVAAH